MQSRSVSVATVHLHNDLNFFKAAYHPLTGRRRPGRADLGFWPPSPPRGRWVADALSHKNGAVGIEFRLALAFRAPDLPGVAVWPLKPVNLVRRECPDAKEYHHA